MSIADTSLMRDSKAAEDLFLKAQRKEPVKTKEQFVHDLVRALGEADREALDKGRRTHTTGAERSTDADNVRFDLISPIGLRRLAARYKMGADKYKPHNWKHGFRCSDVMNHVQNHLNLYLNGDRSDDNLAAAAWGLFTLMHYEESRPDLDDIPGGPAYDGADKNLYLHPVTKEVKRE